MDDDRGTHPVGRRRRPPPATPRAGTSPADRRRGRVAAAEREVSRHREPPGTGGETNQPVVAPRTSHMRVTTRAALSAAAAGAGLRLLAGQAAAPEGAARGLE